MGWGCFLFDEGREGLLGESGDGVFTGWMWGRGIPLLLWEVWVSWLNVGVGCSLAECGSGVFTAVSGRGVFPG